MMPKIIEKKVINKANEMKIININKIHLNMSGIFVGNREVLLNSVLNHFKENNIEIELFLIDRFELSVDDVRAMKVWASQSSEKLKIVIFSSFYWNAPAQNAMLKILEEIPRDTRIFLIAKSKTFFLSTILSRVYIYDYKKDSGDDGLARELLSLDVHVRMQNSKLKNLLTLKIENIDLLKSSNKIEIEENTETDDDEMSISNSKGRKDKEKHIELFEDLFSVLKDEFRKGNKDLNVEYMQKINKLNENIYVHGASPHLSIEYILLSAAKM